VTGTPAWHYDGRTATRHDISVEPQAAAIRFVETGEVIAARELLAQGDAGHFVYGRAGHEGWRLGFDAAPPAALAAILPRQEKHGGLLDRYGVVLPVLIGLAITAVVLLGLWRGAELAARLVPEEWEQGFGEALTGRFEGTACTGAPGQRAIDALATRLGDGRSVSVRVIDLPLVNAAALPGRQVVVFRGLIATAQSPDELAGVLAHEIGHVANRDAMAGLIREYGVSLLFGVADGGVIARSLLSNSYTRAAERRADDHALAALAAANISPRATADFFARMSRAEPDTSRTARLIGYMTSHPLSADRRRLFEGGVKRGHRYAPALDAAQWTAVQGMCPAEETKPQRR
jgi:Zn-dependent protease with chaperone function